jgi:hypothetical protein
MHGGTVSEGQTGELGQLSDAQLIPLDDYYELVGLKPLLAREESYDNAAAALVRKHAAE